MNEITEITEIVKDEGGYQVKMKYGDGDNTYKGVICCYSLDEAENWNVGDKILL